MHLARLSLASGALLLALSGCGNDSPTPGATATGTPAAGGAGTAATTAAAPGGDSCGSVAATVREKLSRPGVQGVTVEGQCTTVVIATTLSDGDAGTARQLCDLAAEVAYTGDVNSIRVLGQAGKELAQGIKGVKCLAGG